MTNRQKLLIENYIRSKVKKIIFEQDQNNDYQRQVISELEKLNSGETLLRVVSGDFTGNAAKYKNTTWNKIQEYIKNNEDKNIPAKRTAEFVRGKWYGV